MPLLNLNSESLPRWSIGQSRLRSAQEGVFGSVIAGLYHELCRRREVLARSFPDFVGTTDQERTPRDQAGLRLVLTDSEGPGSNPLEANFSYPFFCLLFKYFFYSLFTCVVHKASSMMWKIESKVHRNKKKCDTYQSVSSGIFSNTGHCYHYPAQSYRRFSHFPNLIREVTYCFEMGRLNQLNSTVSN